MLIELVFTFIATELQFLYAERRKIIEIYRCVNFFSVFRFSIICTRRDVIFEMLCIPTLYFEWWLLFAAIAVKYRSPGAFVLSLAHS